MSIENELDKIIKNLFKIEIKDNLKDVSLFNEPFNISGRNFLLLFLEIEKKFNFKFSDSAIEEMYIATYNGIVKEIKKSQNGGNIAN